MFSDEDVDILQPFLQEYQDLMRQESTTSPDPTGLIESALEKVLEGISPEKQPTFVDLPKVEYINFFTPPRLIPFVEYRRPLSQ